MDEGLLASVDAEALEQAVAILTSLSGGSSMVGIISHVEELKEQIGSRYSGRKKRIREVES